MSKTVPLVETFDTWYGSRLRSYSLIPMNEYNKGSVAYKKILPELVKDICMYYI